MGWAVAAFLLVGCAYFFGKVETYELFRIGDYDEEK
jgi:hypothetical protein